MNERYNFIRVKTIFILVMFCLLFTACSGQGHETTTATYHPNGKVAVKTFTASPSAGFDFTYEESTYDENGTMLTHTKIQNNGIIGVSTYHYDKSHTTVFTYPDGGGHIEYWYGNNLLGGIGSNGVPWGVTVPGADYSGLDYGGTIGKG